MSLIGILTKKNQESYLKQSLRGIIQEEQIFFLKESSMQNLTNIKFQTILIGKEISKNKEEIKQIAKKADYLIFNTDIIENLNLLDDLKVQLITYGFNSKATITTSSMEENKAMVCLQRVVENVQGKKIEPQERKMHLPEENNSYAVMELMSLQLLYQT